MYIFLLKKYDFYLYELDIIKKTLKKEKRLFEKKLTLLFGFLTKKIDFFQRVKNISEIR